ncbi:hypothetical protein HDU87_006296 [Geranomyces variabilis]|uniref:Uncharacterized protein n=1 Tax=Geranomyces variabilis TaxID=109894 RepID=A0AAD5TL60_9FUNG|nr:hypothetical protein HDU87_006296 [Geranomyces variabilis]
MSLSSAFHAMCLDEPPPAPFNSLMVQMKFRANPAYMMFATDKPVPGPILSIVLLIEPDGQQLKVSGKPPLDDHSEDITLKYFQPVQYILRIDRIFERLAGQKSRFMNGRVDAKLPDDGALTFCVPEIVRRLNVDDQEGYAVEKFESLAEIVGSFFD